MKDQDPKAKITVDHAQIVGATGTPELDELAERGSVTITMEAGEYLELPDPNNPVDNGVRRFPPYDRFTYSCTCGWGYEQLRCHMPDGPEQPIRDHHREVIG